MSRVDRVKCPTCGVINELVAPSASPLHYPPPKDPVPQYSIHEVPGVCRRLLDESVSQWIEVRHNSEGIDSCYKKVYGCDKEKNDVYVTKAKAMVNAPMSAILNVYWNNEHDWDVSTVSLIKIMEDNGNNRIVLKEHKTASAATLRNDVVVRSIYEEYADHIWCYAVSEKYQTLPEKGGWRRGHLVLCGLLIQQVESNLCEVSFVNCFDFGGWIHVKFVEDEQKKVAGRLSRIKKKAEEDYKQSRRPAPSQESSFNYSDAVCNLCSTCNSTWNTKFCPNDGTPLVLSCVKCLTPAKGTKFCSGCGSKLVL
jgi:hypothetical protein